MRFVLCSVFLFLSLFGGRAQAKERPRAKPPVYNHVAGDSVPGFGRAIRAAYGTRFKIIVILDSKSFVRSRCTQRVTPRPQRDASGRLLVGDVRVAFIVTSEGRIIEPFILESSNRLLNDTVVSAMKEFRGAPARLNGVPISTVEWLDFSFQK